MCSSILWFVLTATRCSQEERQKQKETLEVRRCVPQEEILGRIVANTSANALLRSRIHYCKCSSRRSILIEELLRPDSSFPSLSPNAPFKLVCSHPTLTIADTAGLDGQSSSCILTSNGQASHPCCFRPSLHACARRQGVQARLRKLHLPHLRPMKKPRVMLPRAMTRKSQKMPMVIFGTTCMASSGSLSCSPWVDCISFG